MENRQPHNPEDATLEVVEFKNYLPPKIIYTGKLEARASLCSGGTLPKGSVDAGCNAGNITS